MPDSPRLGIDWGKARIGVAASNAGTSFAYPVETVQASPDEQRRLVALVEEYRPGVVYVGLPLTLSGERGIAAGFVEEKAAALAAAIAPVEVRLIDERMSTVTASRSLGSAGRRARQQRQVIDQAAAVEILQRALDVEDREEAAAGRRATEEER